jgi:hypothetical protein
MGINWDEFDTPGDYPEPFKFRNRNDTVVGEVYYVRTTDFGGTAAKVPEIWVRLDDGTEVGVAASQVNLRRLLCQHRPAVGDRIAIVYTGDATSAKAGQSPAKLFDVVVRRAGDLAAPEAPAAPPAAPTQSAPAAPAPPAGQVTADSLI